MKILIMKFRNIGDVLLTSPMASALATLDDKPEVTFLVKAGTEMMLTGHPDIKTVLVVPQREKNESKGSFILRQFGFIKKLRKMKFDMTINTTEGDRGAIIGFLTGTAQRVGYLKPKDKWWRKKLINHVYEWVDDRRHTVLKNLDLINTLVTPESISVSFHFSTADTEKVDSLLRSKGWDGKSALIHVHPVSRWFFKCWQDEYMAEVIDNLHGDNVTVVVTCAPIEKERQRLDSILSYTKSDVIDLGGLLSLKELGALSSIAQQFFGVDSAPMHMAAALNIPCVAIFGPSKAFEWGPWPNGWGSLETPYLKINDLQESQPHRVIQKGWRCVPCGQDGCDGSKKSRCLDELLPSHPVFSDSKYESKCL